MGSGIEARHKRGYEPRINKTSTDAEREEIFALYVHLGPNFEIAGIDQSQLHAPTETLTILLVLKYFGRMKAVILKLKGEIERTLKNQSLPAKTVHQIIVLKMIRLRWRTEEFDHFLSA